MATPGNFPRSIGYNHNFFNEISVSNTDFNAKPDLFITFDPAFLSFYIKGTGSAQIAYSFNGNTIDGYMYQVATAPFNAGRSYLEWYGRGACSAIWFKAISGTATISVEAYQVK